MKNKRISIILIAFFLIFSCVQKASNKSRQFEKLINATVLSKDKKEISINIKSFYVLSSKVSKPFDEKGYFINKNKNSDYLVKAIVRSAVRSVIKNYDSKKLIEIPKKEIETKIGNLINTIITESDEKNNLDVWFNVIFIDEIIIN